MMTTDQVAELGRRYLTLLDVKREVYSDLDRLENVLKLHLQESGKRSIVVDGQVIKAVPGRSPRMSPSARRQIRRAINVAARLGLDQPVRIAVEAVR